MGLGAPVALTAGLVAPQYWLAGPAWVALVLALLAVDVLLSPGRGRMDLNLTAPPSLASGTVAEALMRADFPRGVAPTSVDFAIDLNDRLEAEPATGRATVHDRAAGLPFRLTATRRGEGAVHRISARWRGPLGLMWKQRDDRLERVVPVTLDIAGIKDEALRLFSRDASIGQRIQLDLGGGSDFHALTDFRPGMNRRAIDWKQSARHGALLAKEFHIERNHHIMAAIDTGRLMSEPLLGRPRLDHALNATLLLAYVGLKMGDKVGLFGFDARPNLSSGVTSGPNAFPVLQRLAATIDYSTEETNYTLGLTQLSGQLSRRSLVVVFTDIADGTSAELMLENVGRLLRQHLVLFVMMRDEELEAIERAEPATPDDVSRAVVAASLLRERDTVVSRLRRMGVEIVEAPADRVGPALLASYLDLKRRDLL
ncbi:MAG: DUF58 domain-containing protein [Caulobacter sp.]|nr:DUF58 domain-containing protein [Caulobacter sp.]